ISALDIALWDLAGKVKGMPLHQLIGGAKRSKIPAYASLLRIGTPQHIASECKKAIKLGYSAIKLHETTVPAVTAAREAIGPGVPLMVDMNCPLDGPAAMSSRPSLRTSASVAKSSGGHTGSSRNIGAACLQSRANWIAAGENACTVHQFRQMMNAGAVSHAQPSVIKVGGVTEFLKVAVLADEFGVQVIPHSPYFGPGFLATLHLMAVRDAGMIEVF
ncbi:mandelate racemase/muconate lactonizing enzyme family protein, partial [Bradyrhizobium sp. WSM 1704]|uniref:mandelate racemase/muconate lactonizing enzyme family protein n=1 Tax=Bradyrhizobium semiaridum TaxID=2821404 RepID=UPI0040629888|nr:mandelate racemase/muconate lactonizing enzyme family protein [Bradyrhizobium semiaridum]